MSTKAGSLCEDLIAEILSWLPAKDLLRYRSVSKSWYSIIHHSSFVNKHASYQSRSDNRNILIMPNTSPPPNSHPLYTLYSGNTCETCSTLTFPFIPLESKLLQVVGSGNGLICLGDRENFRVDYQRLYIWNPSIRKIKPVPPCLATPRYNFSAFGIGYHGQSNDYRFVSLTYNLQDHEHSVDLTEARVQVYSLKNNSWRIVNMNRPVIPINSVRKFSVSVNGYIYWLATERRILSFNLANDSFEVMKLHTFGSSFEFYLRVYNIAVVRERLCVLVAPYFGSTERGGEEYEIWMMREHGVYESWTKLCGIQPSYRISGTFGLSVKGELLLFRVVDGREELCLYDHENSRFHRLCNVWSCVFAVTYMDSLALLDSGMSQGR